MAGRECNLSMSPVPIPEPPVLPKVCHGKLFLPADDSTSNVVEKEKSVHADLPRPPGACPPSPPACSLCLGIYQSICHIQVPSLHLGPLSPGAGWDTVDTFFSVLLPSGSCDLFFSDSPPHLIVLSAPISPRIYP